MAKISDNEFSAKAGKQDLQMIESINHFNKYAYFLQVQKDKAWTNRQLVWKMGIMFSEGYIEHLENIGEISLKNEIEKELNNFTQILNEIR